MAVDSRWQHSAGHGARSKSVTASPVGTGRAFLKAIVIMGLSGLLAAVAGCGGPGAPTPSLAASPAQGKAQASSAGTGASPAPASSAPAAGKPAEQTAPSLKAAYVALSGSFLPLWLADATKAFPAHQVAVNMQYIQAGTATTALIAGDVDLLEESAATLLTADLNGHSDLVFLASALNHAQFSLYVAPAIQTAADLKGKVLANDRPGTAVDYGMRVLLSRLGLKPTDVTLRPVGNTSVEYPALLGGQVDGAVMAPPFTFMAKAKGFRELQNIYDVPYQNVGIMARRSHLNELAPALPGFLAAYRDGIRAYNEQPDLAMRVIQEYTKETDPAILQQTYQFYRTTAPFQTDLQPTLGGIKAMLDFLSDTIPAAKTAVPEQFVDLRFLSQMPA